MFDIDSVYEKTVQEYEKEINEYCEEKRNHLSSYDVGFIYSDGWGLVDDAIRYIPEYFHTELYYDVKKDIDNAPMTAAERKKTLMKNNDLSAEATKKKRVMYDNAIKFMDSLAKGMVESRLDSNAILFSLPKEMRDKIFNDLWQRAHDSQITNQNKMFTVMEAYMNMLEAVEFAFQTQKNT